MAEQYKTFSDGVVLPAEEVQDYLMDQSIVKVDDSSGLANLPNSVKTAYVLNTGVLMARDNLNAWYPSGGTATVSETAPTNPQTGALWIKPSEVLPLPVRTVWSNVTGITNTSFGTIGRTQAYAPTKAVMCTVQWGGSFFLNASANTDYEARLAWTGALTGDSQTQSKSSMFYRVYGANTAYFTWHSSFTIVLPAGTTTFDLEATRTATSTQYNINGGWIAITPVQWADAYAAGVT